MKQWLLFYLLCISLNLDGNGSHVSDHGRYLYTISIIAITHNEHPYLVEWIDYHRLIGVDHFYIYDNNDNDETQKVLDEYVKAGIVEYIKWPRKDPYFQMEAYRDALPKCRGVTKWVSVLDTDEFIVPTKYFSLTETLCREYEQKPLIYVNWRIFGTSFLWLPPPTLILPFLNKCSEKNFEDNSWGKMIVRPEYLLDIFYNMHISPGIVPFVDGSGNALPFSSQEEFRERYPYPVHDDFLIINHYSYRDEWFWTHVKKLRVIFFGRVPEHCYDRNVTYYNVEENFRIHEIIKAGS